MLHLFRRKKPADNSIGGVAIWMGFITAVQLDDAILAKRLTSKEQLLGEILIAQGALTRSQLDRVLDVQKGLRGGVENYAGMLNEAVAMAHEGITSLGAQVEELSVATRRVATARKK